MSTTVSTTKDATAAEAMSLPTRRRVVFQYAARTVCVLLDERQADDLLAQLAKCENDGGCKVTMTFPARQEGRVRVGVYPEGTYDPSLPK